MTRDEQEMIMWRRVYERWYAREGYEVDTCGDIADAAVAEFRKRYPVEPTALKAAWYDEPPFAKDGESYPCWICGEDDASAVHWSHYDLSPRWMYLHTEDDSFLPLAGRRVCPIVKPQEPTT